MNLENETEKQPQPVPSNNNASLHARLLPAVVIIAILIGFFCLRELTNYAFDVLIGCLMILGALEVENLLRKMDRPTILFVVGGYPILSFILTIVAVNLGFNILDYLLTTLIALLSIFILMFAIPMIFTKSTSKAMARDEYHGKMVVYSMSKSLNTIFVCIWPCLLFSFAFIINHFAGLQVALNSYIVAYQSTTDVGLLGLLLLFVTTMFADTCAMFIGKLIKTPKISLTKLGPGKSWSGLIGGILGASIGAILLFVIFNSFTSYNSLFSAIGINVWSFMLAGLFCGGMSMLGDILASLFKRRAVVKDFSQLIPGHGGIMDRINGLIFNSVAVYTVLCILFA